MNVILIFLAAIAAIIIWWLSGQRLTSKPWLETGSVQLPDHIGADRRQPPAVKIGLFVFLGVVGAVFSLAVSAYFMRMASADWWGMPVPRLLWVNTAALASSSAALQWARREAGHGRMESLRPALVTGLALAVFFLVGQIQAWRELVSAGYVLADNPANSFFYMLTGLHGLHILGGLAVLAHTTVRAFSTDVAPERLRLSVDLSAIYSHFMLAVWLLLFALFAGWANDFVDLCRTLLT
ncbi:Heme/copper-type cytochrome/quinol oxidase, subunit 3 (plasmid) [Neorhizobium galegae bv. officinalis bv. officinalis str. HAMBI 1141]|jgi:cytochrome c oxidase subunit 3|uniref:Heme/copper-type cytochrome/quinol oxidase, subunit 3 n=1 Tax=Neorhizobium galegae bv. officinalis bv. officinalis str. HAMBI 1141 TaxID=1028801 RepID=A0A068TGH3_NEOGA|nr:MULTISPECIES: cytochrome c oxidase subunit 3 [Neorhizobium]MCJ9669383.1 cytochrome c oxidase subunit 3 [Neorhizobium sp. SHOUNA12B]MCJ9745251.1 cytochrome c oxidase subunit 3 [Neorhizobium sp. SHOUNA12A]CDN57547.1 Heme/copper-type cytochrome/quinol oxidase, subunit 3 [Neorhizobium galegae bv. officinalis bv. officinalis str. HAMBI 1141]